MKLKNALYYLIVTMFIVVLFGLGYYISVNTVFARSVLPNVWVNSSDLSFSSEDELKQKVQEQALINLPERFNLTFENEHLSIPTNELEIAVDTYNLVNYGKGDDILKVIASGLNIIKGVKVDVEYSLNTQSFLSKLSINAGSKKSAIEGSIFKCIKNSYPISSVNSTVLAQDIIGSIRAQTEFKFELEDYLADPTEKEIYIGCSKYFADYRNIQENFIDSLAYTNLKFEDLFELRDLSGVPTWKIIDSQILNEHLEAYKNNSDVAAQDGTYEIINNQIYLYNNYVEGHLLDKDATVVSIYSWINSSNLDSNPLIYKVVKPEVLSLGLPILDFTQKIGEGKTRIELIRNGYDNFVIAYTMFGLDEINKTVVNSGEEFSYIKAIQPQSNGTTKSGRPIAGGICNSTTTLFRAVLESGLKVVDRSYHAFSVPSYEWGYPLNIVDAAYFTTPVVDFKFKNDSEYPILLKVSYSKDSDYQYNTVEILTSSKAQKRQVELSNWKVWDKFSTTNFKGSFDRTVSENGQVLFKDNFYSHYL